MLNNQIVQEVIENLNISARILSNVKHIIVISSDNRFPILYLDRNWSKRDAVFYLKREFKK